MFEEIEIIKGEAYLKTAKHLSEVIASLPLNYDQNNELIAAILEHTEAGRKEAYAQAVSDMCMMAQIDEEDKDNLC